MKRLTAILFSVVALLIVALSQEPPEMLLVSRPNPQSAGTTPPSSLVTNLVAYWRLDEITNGTGTTREDAVGANDLTDSGLVGYASGIVTNCGAFESASSQYLTINDNDDLSTESTDFSVSCWFLNTTTNATDYLVAKYGAANEREWYLYFDTGSKIQFTIYTNDATALSTLTSTRWNTNTWHFVAATLNRTDQKVTVFVRSLDGTKSEWSTNSAPRWDQAGSGSAFNIAARNAAGFWDGKLDEVGFWKRALTSNEMVNLFNYGNGGTNYPWTALP